MLSETRADSGTSPGSVQWDEFKAAGKYSTDGNLQKNNLNQFVLDSIQKKVCFTKSPVGSPDSVIC